MLKSINQWSKNLTFFRSNKEMDLNIFFPSVLEKTNKLISPI